MKLFVGNLSWNTAEEDLRDAFARFGEIDECRIITDRETGRSRGFGFITFVDQDCAQAAMNEMNGSEVDGRSLNVNEAKERAPKRDRGDRW